MQSKFRMDPFGICLALLALVPGCATMCDSSLDCNYAAYGGVRDRVDRAHGRVASVFDPAAAHELDQSDQGVGPSLPDAAQQPNLDSEDGQPDTGEVEDSGLREQLLRELDKMRQQLPTLPAPDDSESEFEF